MHTFRGGDDSRTCGIYKNEKKNLVSMITFPEYMISVFLTKQMVRKQQPDNLDRRKKLVLNGKSGLQNRQSFLFITKPPVGITKLACNGVIHHDLTILTGRNREACDNRIPWPAPPWRMRNSWECQKSEITIPVVECEESKVRVRSACEVEH